MTLEEHTTYLWALCYRMTASAQDADDLVQDTFLRALESPPADTSRPWRPWLTRVAVNLSLDALRKRRGKTYEGPWLPEPFITDEPPADAPLVDDRIGLLESATFAFMLALETLDENQRAVLLLREVFELDDNETAETLELSTDDVKQILHLARGALAPYFAARTIPSAALAERNQRALAGLLEAVERRDVQAVIDALADDAVCLTDGGGRVKAALNPIIGDQDVARLMIGLGITRALPVYLNGLPAIVAELTPRDQTYAARTVLRCDSDGDGRVRALHAVVNPRKLSRLRI